MSTKTILLRRDTYQNWVNANPVLASGEPSYDISNKTFRIGDGATPWSGLDEFTSDGFVQQSAIADLDLTVSDPPTQAEVQAVADKVDAILSALRAAGVIAS